jgi:hypothetical protein
MTNLGLGTRIKLAVPSYKSKLEEAWAAELERLRAAGEVVLWRYEAMALRLGPDCVWWPDFVAVRRDGQIVVYEVKGRRRDDGMAKLKVAAQQWPELRVYLVTRDGGARGTWKVEQVVPHGMAWPPGRLER